MKTLFTNKFFLLSFVMAGLFLISSKIYAQLKPGEQSKEQKTITIHVTKVEGGKTTVIDTTVVTEGDFDADAYLQEKGVLNDIPEKEGKVEKHIIIRHPGNSESEQSESDENLPDTIIINTDHEYAFNDNFDRDAPPSPHHPDMPFEYFLYDNPQGFSHFEGPRMEDMLQELASTLGLEGVMPFGDMKQIVVKKKHHGKKMIITFEDRENTSGDHGKKHEEKVIILNDNNTGMAPRREEKVVIVQGNPGERTATEKEIENAKPAKQQQKVIIIQEEKTK